MLQCARSLFNCCHSWPWCWWRGAAAPPVASCLLPVVAAARSLWAGLAGHGFAVGVLLALSCLHHLWCLCAECAMGRHPTGVRTAPGWRPLPDHVYLQQSAARSWLLLCSCLQSPWLPAGIQLGCCYPAVLVGGAAPLRHATAAAGCWGGCGQQPAARPCMSCPLSKLHALRTCIVAQQPAGRVSLSVCLSSLPQRAHGLAGVCCVEVPCVWRGCVSGFFVLGCSQLAPGWVVPGW